jgi:hypothetical protein
LGAITLSINVTVTANGLSLSERSSPLLSAISKMIDHY